MNRNKRQPPATLPTGFYSAPRIPIVETEEASNAVVYYAYNHHGQPRPPPPLAPPPGARRMIPGDGSARNQQIAAAAAAATTNRVAPGASSWKQSHPSDSQQQSPAPGRGTRTTTEQRRAQSDGRGSSSISKQQGHTGGTRGMAPAGGGFQTVAVQAPGCPVQHFQICVGNDPDDIRKWIQERKRRFPRQKKLSDLLGAYGDSSSSEDDEDDEAKKEEMSEETLSAPQKDAVALSATSVSFMEASAAGVSAASKDDSDHFKTMRDMLQRPPGTATTKNPREDHHSKRRKLLLCRYFANGTCKSGVNCSFSHETPVTALAPPTSLMGKLLEQERRREAALTLQLLYMVHSEFDYFQNYSDEADETTTTTATTTTTL